MMTKLLLLMLALYFAVLGAALFIAPLSFYEVTPGVSDTGPFNAHVFRDVGLAFLLSGLGLCVGSLRHDRLIALFGAGFPMLHGLFHLMHWGAHGMVFAPVPLFELVTILFPAALAIFLSLQISKGVPA